MPYEEALEHFSFNVSGAYKGDKTPIWCQDNIPEEISDIKMAAKEKSEWFELDKPIGEPGEVKHYREPSYWIERVVKNNGEIVWFGLGINWISKDNGETWQYLGTDHSVQPLEEGGCVYPEGRNIWIDCEPPIYEKLYLKITKK